MTWNVGNNVRKEAEHWFARRLEPATRDAEHEAFQRWRANDPRRAEAYAEVERVWDDLAILKRSQRLRLAVPEPAASDDRTGATSTHPRARYRVFFAFAASCAALIVLAVLWLNRGTPAVTLATELGEQRTETLADGTTLRLNTSSMLDVEISARERAVTLRSGEAAFDVVKDPSRVFVVSAGDGTITAVGTHFQVRHEADAVTVTLMEGRVHVVRPARREVEWLDPGQQATFSAGASGIVKRNVDVGALTSWMTGRLEFRGTLLEQAVAEANRYSARKLRIGDPGIRQLPVSGTFRTGDVASVATAFEAAFPVRAELGEHEIVLRAR
jgi:transmembrane sensor